jgi:ribosomal-protein-alanine N-acetyltransferase
MSVQPISRPRSRNLQWRLLEMERSDLAEVTQVEADLYTFPWSRGNFEDSLASGYSAWIARGEDALLLGYFLLMPAVDEAHLLNISVARHAQRQGLGRALLDKASAVALEFGTKSLILEVRPSNPRAIAIYERYGFRQIGIRRGYYPADHRDASLREDALVWRYAL